MTNSPDDRGNTTDTVIYIFVAPELEGEALNILEREEGKTGERYAARSEALRILFGGSVMPRS